MTAKTFYSGLSLIAAIVIALFAIWIQPMGIIDTSVLYITAQLLIYSASLMGISSAVATIINALREHLPKPNTTNAKN